MGIIAKFRGAKKESGLSTEAVVALRLAKAELGSHKKNLDAIMERSYSTGALVRTIQIAWILR
jgi:hypothetical protein